MATYALRQTRRLRQLMEPEIMRRTGQPMKALNPALGHLAQACELGDPETVNLDLLVGLTIESGWAETKNPHVDTERWIAARYIDDTMPGGAVDPVLGTVPVTLSNVTVVGGTGWALAPGRAVTCVFGMDGLEIVARTMLAIPYAEIESIQLHGGTDVSGGGFFGGGFGVEGAAIGMLTSTMLNALTTTTKTYTLLEITTREGELFLFYEGTDPGALRIALSHAFTSIRLNNRRA